MSKPAVPRKSVELYCLSVLLGSCAGVIYILGTTIMRVLNIW